MTELYKAVYHSPRTFMKYDSGRIILYPDETVIENYTPEKRDEREPEPTPFTAYQYEGEEKDGGYIRDCADPTDLHELANAIIRAHYGSSEEFALQRHYTQQPETYKAKWEAYCEYADKAADLARKWLGIEK